MKRVKLLIIGVFIFNSYAFSQNSFAKELTRRLFIDIFVPEFCTQGDSCYRYTELLKIEIEKTGKIESICFSDSAPGWLKENLDRSIKNKIFNFRRLDSVAKDNHYVDCTLVFPVLLKTFIPPTEIQKGLKCEPDNFFVFNKKQLSGNIIFGESICIIPIWTIINH
ncbi:MAG: hypothetical protein BWZ05_01351 [Bacteroidetes bacterium ADurb.BinA245]|jgi:hypothetical protein|nr:hypothetical protein [Chitinophagaceae bacterium]OPZ17525.1 MAG: hypothetical protein BWZ05_01351 [Bacteroidetes bacterium ADurb.BinA245]